MRGVRVAGLAFFAASLLAAAAPAQSREFDDWAGFPVGSWCEVHTKSEAVGGASSSSTTRTRVTITRSTTELIELRILSVVDNQGKKFEAPPTTIELRPFGQEKDEKLAIGLPRTEKITVEDATYSCQALEAELTGPAGTRKVTAYFRPAAPHSPLRRTVVVTDAQGNEVHSVTSEAIAVDIPHTVSDKLHDAMLVKSHFKNHKTASTTWSVHCATVPGQLVQSSTKEYDANGDLKKITSQEIIDFGEPAEETRGTTVRARWRQRREERRNRS